MGLFDKLRKKPANPVVEMICGNLKRFGVPVRDYGMNADFHNGEVYNYIYTDHTKIKMVPNQSDTAFTTMIDTSIICRYERELGPRIEEFVKSYIAVLFIHTVLSQDDIEKIKNGEPYCKNGIRSIIDRKEDSLYVTIFDSNTRTNDHLLQNYR